MSTGILLIILIVAAVAIGYVVFSYWGSISNFINSILSRSTTTTIQPYNPQYKDDIITIEDYYVSDTNPYVNSGAMISFLVKNNGEYNVPYVKVKFAVPGFEIAGDGLYCEGTDAFVADSRNSGSCTFNKSNSFGELQPFDTRSISLSLKTPNINILSPMTFTVSYTVEYNYSGFKKMDIPIVNSTTRKEPLSEYSESTATYGPIKLAFEPPVGRERVEQGRTVQEYFGVDTNPIRVKMKFTQTSSSTPEIEVGKVSLDLRGSLKKASVGGTPLPCDFCESSEAACLGKKEGYLVSTKSVDIPGELVCNFQSVGFEGPETTATIWAEFNYTYSYSKYQRFEVQPIPEESIPGGSGAYDTYSTTTSLVTGPAAISSTTTNPATTSSTGVNTIPLA